MLLRLDLWLAARAQSSIFHRPSLLAWRIRYDSVLTPYRGLGRVRSGAAKALAEFVPCASGGALPKAVQQTTTTISRREFRQAASMKAAKAAKHLGFRTKPEDVTCS